MDKYVGEWSKGEQEGYGSLFYRNGARYVSCGTLRR